MLHWQELNSFVTTALECSVYIAPNDPGLFFDEILQVGRAAGYQDGEVTDAVQRTTTQYFGRHKIEPDVRKLHWNIFSFKEEPDFRNFEAFDFILGHFNELKRQYGGGAAKIERSVLIERGKDAAPKHDLEVALRILIYSELLKEKDGVVSATHPTLYQPLPSEQRKSGAGPIHYRRELAKLYPLVKDVIERRTDRRLPSPEPLDAFASALERLGLADFRLWWVQLVSELRQASTLTASVTVTVLAAALVEGALAFVVSSARQRQLPVFRSSDFDGDPRRWKIENLVASATAGGDAAILDASTRARADDLIRTRQRIHAGRMLAEFPKGPPDLQPDTARDAVATAELVVRRVLEWLDKFP